MTKRLIVTIALFNLSLTSALLAIAVWWGRGITLERIIEPDVEMHPIPETDQEKRERVQQIKERETQMQLDRMVRETLESIESPRKGRR